eukprot:UN21905
MGLFTVVELSICCIFFNKSSCCASKLSIRLNIVCFISGSFEFNILSCNCSTVSSFYLIFLSLYIHYFHCNFVLDREYYVVVVCFL